MDKDLVRRLAQELLQASMSGKPVQKMTSRYPQITVEDAYAIQLEGQRLREQAGRKVVGAKIGLTSKAMQEQFKVYEPDYGYIMDDMIVFENDPIKMSEHRMPKVEAEIAFVLKEDLQGPGISIADVLRATEGIIPSLEIIDTRYDDFGISVQDSIADIASIGKVVLGGKLIPIGDIDLRYTGLVFEKNGEVVSTAAGAAVLGHPAHSVAWLINKLSVYGVGLRKGNIVISGSLIAACGVEAGDNVCATFDKLGSVSTRFI